MFDDEFLSYKEKFDVFGLLETWEENLTENIKSRFPNNCIYFCKAVKKSRFGRAMGCIVVLIKNSMNISRIENVDCNFGIFFKCYKSLFDIDKDVLMSFVYLPPQGSPFYKHMERNGIDLLEDLYIKLPIYDKYHIIIGDLNSRTGILKYYF